MNPLKLGVAGASGRMGRTLIEFISDRQDAEVAGATERDGHPWINRSIADCISASDCGRLISSDPEEAFRSVDAIIDFTTPDNTVSNASVAARHRIVHVIGTTGLENSHLASISKAAESTVVVRAGNMSLGVNLLVGLTRQVAAALDEDFDIEIFETHHRYKVDAPSGTAFMLGQAAASGRGLDSKKARAVFHVGSSGSRTRGSIGYSSVRGGDIVGEHDAIFAADGERLILRHIATDRAIYARGAVAAAIWGHGRPNGEYSMADVLGLK